MLTGRTVPHAQQLQYALGEVRRRQLLVDATICRLGGQDTALQRSIGMPSNAICDDGNPRKFKHTRNVRLDLILPYVVTASEHGSDSTPKCLCDMTRASKVGPQREYLATGAV